MARPLASLSVAKTKPRKNSGKNSACNELDPEVLRIDTYSANLVGWFLRRPAPQPIVRGALRQVQQRLLNITNRSDLQLSQDHSVALLINPMTSASWLLPPLRLSAPANGSPADDGHHLCRGHEGRLHDRI